MGLYALGWRFVEACLALALFLLPFSKSGVEIALWTALVAWLFGKIVLRYGWRIPKKLTVLYAFFLFAVLISMLQIETGHAATAWRGFFKWFKFVGLFFLSYEAFQDEKRAGRIRFVLLVSVALTVLNGFYQMFHETDLIKGYTVDIPGRGIRMRSSFGSPNDLAGYLLLGFPLAFGSWMTQKKWSWKSVLTAMVAVGSGVAFVSTLSRAAFLALLVSIIIFALFRRKFIWIGLAMSFLAVLFLASGALRDNFVASLNPNDITVGERLRFWNVTLDMIRERPWTGHGINSYFYTFPLYADAQETYRGYAHNSYLQMASETGLVGLALFLAALFWTLWRSWIKELDIAGGSLAIGLTAILFLNAVDTQFYSLQQSALFWIFWGMLAARIA